MRVQYLKAFNKQFKKLDLSIKRHFKERRDLFLNNPSHLLLDNHPLHPPFEGSRSINVTGNFRAIFKQIEKDLVVFTDIGTHHQLFGT